MSEAVPDAPGRFRDHRLTSEERLDDLLDALTAAEKIALLHQHQAAVPRLGLGSFRTGTEALHGVAWLGPATVFPQAVGLACAWDTGLMRAVGTAVGDETRGFHHRDPDRVGLNVWAPVVNPLRDPRWGRNEEGYAEDPRLTAALATAYAAGLCGDRPDRLRTAPTLKHFLAYNNETRRDATSSTMGARVLHEYELPAFRGPIAAGTAVAVMASYNLVNGRPAHLSRLINDEVRRWTPDHVLVVSDAQAPSNVVEVQRYHPDHVAGHAALLRNGIDSFTDNGDDPSLTIERVTGAIRRGLLTGDDVDRAVRRILAVRLRLGEFDPPDVDPYRGITDAVIDCAEHRALARRAARQAIVLLKNAAPDGTPTLPLDASACRRVALSGPLADTVLPDWYSGTLPYAYTARAGIAEHLGADQPGSGATVDAVEGADVVALRVGADGGPYAGRYVTVDGRDGAPLRAGADTAHFVTPDWGGDLLVLRATTDDRYVTVDDTGALHTGPEQPGGWVVRELFRLVERGDGDVVLRHAASRAYVTVDPDGRLRARVPTPDEATAFVVEVVHDGVATAARAAAEADVAVVVVGNHPMINGRETEDRPDLELPAGQQRLVRAVLAANPHTVLVVTSSYPYAIGWADENVPAIVYSAHGGQEFGRALADVLFGVVSPGGHLTQTWYRSAADLPDLLDYDIIANDATYLYFRGDPLYPFGHGLTYSTVTYGDLRLSAATVSADGEVTVGVDVRNTGDGDVDEVVQLYTRQRRSVVKQPVRRLVDFARVALPAGATRTVELRIRAADLAFWDVTRGGHVVEDAVHAVLVGRSSADIRACAELRVAGETIGPRGLTGGPWAAADHDGYAEVVLSDADPDDTGGPHPDAVTATGAGGWICFDRVDVAGAVTCHGRLRRVGGGPATVTLRLDDPLGGPVLGTLTTTGTADDPAGWAEAEAPMPAVGGVRPLYAVFDRPGVALRSLWFTPEALEAPEALEDPEAPEGAA